MLCVQITLCLDVTQYQKTIKIPTQIKNTYSFKYYKDVYESV